jgi:predicted kinase
MTLAVFAGLPGVGKSTLAQQVGAALPAAVLAVDTVDFTLATYREVAALAETQLRMGHHVIIDAVNPVKAARQIWVELAESLDVPLRVVEVVCGDDAEHRRRIATRPERARERQGEYEPFIGPRLVVDTSLAREPVGPVVDYLTLRTS